MRTRGGNLCLMDKTWSDLPLCACSQTFCLKSALSAEVKNTLLSHFWLSVLFPWHHFESISNRINILCCWEDQATSQLGKALSTGICNKTFYQDGWGTLEPWVRKNCSNLHWEPDLTKCAMLGMEYTPLKEGRRWESWPSISHPQFISVCLTVLPSPANI